MNDRLTTNLGIRVEHHHLFSQGGVKTPSQFGQAATYGDMDILTWNGAAPRAGAAWDIRGNGKTVLKGQWGRYLHLIAANAGSSFNPATVTATTYTWHDLNGNLLYDTGEVNLDPQGVDFVGLSQRSSASGLSTSPRPFVNSDLRQPHTDETSIYDRAGTGEQDGGARPGCLQADLRRLRQRAAPSSLLGVEHPASRARIQVPTAWPATPTTAAW